jgi:hypothetical protein
MTHEGLEITKHEGSEEHAVASYASYFLTGQEIIRKVDFESDSFEIIRDILVRIRTIRCA